MEINQALVWYFGKKSVIEFLLDIFALHLLAALTNQIL
jgi:hypothetical protein